MHEIQGISGNSREASSEIRKPLFGISGPPAPFVRTGATSSSESLSQSTRGPLPLPGTPPPSLPLSLSSKVASKQLSEVCLRNEAIHEEEDREPHCDIQAGTGNGVKERTEME